MQHSLGDRQRDSKASAHPSSCGNTLVAVETGVSDDTLCRHLGHAWGTGAARRKGDGMRWGARMRPQGDRQQYRWVAY